MSHPDNLHVLGTPARGWEAGPWQLHPRPLAISQSTESGLLNFFNRGSWAREIRGFQRVEKPAQVALLSPPKRRSRSQLGLVKRLR
jgi:hypothetical protein